jgi:hypothetical protein
VPYDAENHKFLLEEPLPSAGDAPHPVGSRG